jgi:hypothetical protein
VSRRARIRAYGGAALLVVVGGVCGVAVPGVTGDAFMIGLMMIGLGGALLLAFFEVGLSEDRDREREERRRSR